MLSTGYYYIAAGYALFMAQISFYGLKLLRTQKAAMSQRFAALRLSDELHAQQAQTLRLERDRALLLEREHLTRDMHDGLGSALVSALIAVENGETDPSRLAEILRDCVDGLRAVLEFLEPIDHDLVSLLAALRFRLGRRLEGAGIRWNWQVADLPPLLWLGPSEALQVMRIVQETLANVVKHSGATEVTVSTRHDGPSVSEGKVLVTITDNGRDFDVASLRPGRGLPSLSKRAHSLNAKVCVTSELRRGVCVELSLPVGISERPPTGPSSDPARVRPPT